MKNKSTELSAEEIPIGGYILSNQPITFNENKPITVINVINTGDRPIQIGSHFHFFEVNKQLEFDRSQAFGKRLNITSTTAIRFEPGDEISVELIPYGGKQVVYGFNNLVDGWLGCTKSTHALGNPSTIQLENAMKNGFKFSK